MSDVQTVNVTDTVYRDVHDDTKMDTLRDYDNTLVLVKCLKIEDTGFYLYTVSDWLYVYAGSVIWLGVSTLLFLSCIIIVNILINRIIRWQSDINRKLQDAVDYATNAGKAKSQFLAQMSHEIRTPINAVIGMDEMILREAKEEHIREYATNIQSAGRTLLELINSILDFSKIEEGKMEIHPVKYETRKLVDYLSNMIEERAEKKGLTYITDISPEIPESLFGDDVRLKQVIINLLTNAVKYTHEGSVKLRMLGRFEDEENYYLTVSVEDTGIGVKKEDMEKLFESFERLEEEENRNIEGTGLGISIVQGLLTKMDSHLEVDSTYGKGSCFYFTIPQRIINSTPIGTYTREKHVEGGIRKEAFFVKDADVLVVDDNDMNLKVAAGILKLYKVKPDMASNGKKALEMVRTKRYDLIFLDHMMPGMDGVETFHKMQKEDLVYDTPVICLTANAIAGVREKYLKEGFADYLSKPIEIVELEKILESYLPKEKLIPVNTEEEGSGSWTEDVAGNAAGNVAANASRGIKKTAGEAKKETEKEVGSAKKETGKEDGSAGEQTESGAVSMAGNEAADLTGKASDSVEGAAGNAAEEGGSPIEILKRNGINTDAGIEYAAGMEEFYLEVVQTFADGYDDKTKEIRADYEEKNWENYRTRVHALKSTAKMIGATELSNAALEQEMAAKDVVQDVLEKGYQPLLDKYTEVVEIIRKALKQNG